VTNKHDFCWYRNFIKKTRSGPDRIGSIYKKAIYRGYTDATFTQQVVRPQWAGFVGPLIKAEVDDVVFIHFRNRATGSNFSVHPHGFQYNKSNEGRSRSFDFLLIFWLSFEHKCFFFLVTTLPFICFVFLHFVNCLKIILIFSQYVIPEVCETGQGSM
jgi:hypothetical protein